MSVGVIRVCLVEFENQWSAGVFAKGRKLRVQFQSLSGVSGGKEPNQFMACVAWEPVWQ